jgi:hypothetical protein
MKKVFLRFNWKNTLLEITEKENLPYDREKFLDIEADFIGKGLFCHAFKGDDSRVYLLVKQSQNDFDYSKEAINNWGDSENPHMPEIESFGQFTFKGAEYIVFSMPFYEPLTAKHKTAWAQFKTLQKAFYSLGWGDNRTFYNRSFALVDSLEAGSIKEALQSILDAGSNYGPEYGLEFSKQNMSVNKEGVLILRDVLFNSDLCRKIRESKVKRAYQYR